VHATLIRPAGAADAAAIAALHVASWRSAYRGMLPDAYLDGPIEAERAAYWQATLAQPAPGDAVLLAPGAGFVAGFAAPDGDALLDNLHVLPARRGGGLGAALLVAVARALAAGGARAMHLWVFDANAGARRFYERHGAVPTAQRVAELFGASVPETRLAWPDLRRLADQSTSR
jgi:hypothetical protein